VAGRARFVDHVIDIVDDVGVVAAAADHGVGAGSAVEIIIAGAADHQVVAAQPIDLIVFAVVAEQDETVAVEKRLQEGGVVVVVGADDPGHDVPPCCA
jgi:hypothetical protein